MKEQVEKAILDLRPFLKNLQDKIRHRSEDEEFSWTCGGCFAFAEAINKGLPKSKLCVVGQFDKEVKDWVSQHAFVQYQNTYFDYNGTQTEEELKKYFVPSMGKVKLGEVEKWTNLWYPEQEYVTDEEIKAIKNQFVHLLN